MGNHIRHSLIVTGEGIHFKNAYKKAKILFDSEIDGLNLNLVSNITSSFNGYLNFCVFDAGSKVGWSLNDEFEKRIEKFVNYLNSNDCKFSDGSSFNQWVLIEYGDTGRRIKKSNCKNKF